MSNKKTVCTALLIMTGLASAMTQAGDRAGAFFVRPSIAHYFPASKRHLEGTGAPQLILGYDASERWGMGAGVTVLNTSQKSDIGGENVHGFLYTFDAIYRLETLKGFSPWVFAGPMITSLKPPTGSDPINQAGASAGVGAGYYFSDSIGLSAEARDLYTFSGGKNDFLLTAGLVFLLGGQPEQPTVKAAYK